MNVKATRKNSEHFYSKRLIKIKDLSTSNKFTRMLCLCLFTSRLPITEAVIQISSKTNVHLVVAIINSHFPRHRYVNRHNNVAKHTCNHPFPSSSWAYTSQQLASTANTHSSNYHHKAHNIRTNLRFSLIVNILPCWPLTLCLTHISAFLKVKLPFISKRVLWLWIPALSLSVFFYFKQVSEPHQLKLKHNLKVLLIVVPALCRSRRHRQKERKMLNRRKRMCKTSHVYA